MEGLLLVDKPAGPTSQGVVAHFRKILGEKSLGHAGTLDPQATGLLVLAIGPATRWLPYLPSDKAYRATLKLGLATDTEDIWGKPTAETDASAVTPEALRTALQGLTDLKAQVPPMVSALKKDGQRLYELARQGMVVDRPERPVSIGSVKVLALRPGEADFEVECSAGTYVRSLCVEAGKRLGLPACMSALRRLRSGPFRVEQALPEARWTKEAVQAALLGHEQALPHLPALELDEAQARAVQHGRALTHTGPGGTWRLSRQGRLLALAQADPAGSRLLPKKVFA